MTTSVPELAAIARSVRFDAEHLNVQLADGRELAVPLAWFPRLQHATPEQREHWRLIGHGVGVHWPDIDEDVSVPICSDCRATEAGGRVAFPAGATLSGQ